MIRSRARNLIIALSLFAAVGGSMLPGSHPAAAAPIPAAESITDAQWELEQVKPKPVWGHNAGVVDNTVFVAEAGGRTHYGFRVRATSGQLGNPVVKMRAQYSRNSDGGFHSVSAEETKALFTIVAPSYGLASFICEPPVGTYCENVGGTVETSNGVNIIFVNPEDGRRNLGY